MSVFFQQLEDLIRQNNGHLYDYGQDGLIVTNSSGNEIVHLPSEGACGIDPQDFERAKQFFSDICSRQEDPKETVARPMAWVDAEGSILSDSEQRTSFGKALKEMAECYSTIVRIHFDNNPIVQQDVLLPFIESLQDEMAKGWVKIQFYGTFARLEESVMEFLFSSRIQLYYVLDTRNWNQNKEAVCRLSEYGFRVPCVWYVDSDHIHLIPSLIGEAMEWNYDAGFSLPLASERAAGLVKHNPSNADYLRLILDTYKKYPCYDDVFYPMNKVLLESMGGVEDTASNQWRWNHEHSSFCEYFHDASAEKIRNILRHSFIWQRHIVKDRLHSFFAKNPSLTKTEADDRGTA